MTEVRRKFWWEWPKTAWQAHRHLLRTLVAMEEEFWQQPTDYGISYWVVPNTSRVGSVDHGKIQVQSERR